jgi:hypothetical protein
MLTGIFINYRHGPHSVSVAALADRLAAHFGHEQVFVDHRMASGSRYPDELRDHLAAADVLVAVIHTGWVDGFDREHDWVRWEIGTALATGKEVVPLLLEDTRPPTRADLPEEIGELALRQADRIRAAHLADDVDRLVLRLERWVARDHPTTSRPPLRPPRLWRAATPLSALVVVPPVGAAVALGNDPGAYLVVALASLVGMMSVALTFAGQSLMSKPVSRLERRTGELPYVEYLRTYWVLGGLSLAVLAIGLIEFIRQGGQWRIYLMLFFLVLFAHYVDRLRRRYTRYDREWPPEPSPDRHRVRRTAVRLHEFLTGPPGPYPSRSRLHREQAAQVYLELAEVRLFLIARRDCTWRDWSVAGHTAVPITFLAWTAGITGLLTTASVLRAASGEPATRVYLAGTVVVLITAATAAASIALHRLDARRTDSRVVAELTEWQQVLGPLVFVRDDTRVR